MSHRRLMLCVVVSVLALALLSARAAGPATAPAARRVLIISVDGLRPDLLLRGNTPTLHRLLDEGTYTMWAQTTAVSVTIPSHVSMLTGARPQVHQIEWNHDIPLATPIYPKVPTLFELAHNAGFSTGVVTGKSKFTVLNKPGTVDFFFAPEEEVIADQEVLSQTLKVLASEKPPQVLFVHLPENDKVGHAVGWGTPQQMEVIRNADAIVGTILGTLRSRGLLDKTLVIVTADHGGAGRQHGPDDVRSRCIPWIAVGPGVRRGLDLPSVVPNRTVRTEDTFATACAFLGIAVNPDLDGKPVAEIYDRAGEELMAEAAPEKAPATRPASPAPPRVIPFTAVPMLKRKLLSVWVLLTSTCSSPTRRATSASK